MLFSGALAESRSHRSDPLPDAARWWREWQFIALGLLVAAIYFPRVTAAPVCGEESRWATVAREMLASGDLVVPRQQGTVFPERPPLGSWAMAAVALIRGDVDLWAIRIPSVLATLATSLLIYGCARSLLTARGSLAAGVAYATCGQVLALGRLGESEALFTLFAGGALLVWYYGYLRGWGPARLWSTAYSLAAMGALVKGLQAPVYLFVATASFLALKREWRLLVSAGHIMGLACFTAFVAAWVVPFSLREPAVLADVWTLLARERFAWGGLIRHLAEYPAETFGCLLPWSVVLLVFVSASARRAILASRPQIFFFIVAIAVTYPSVWLASGARGRYFMPLYPCLAIVIGGVIEYCTSADAIAWARLAWRRYERALLGAGWVAALAMIAINLFPSERLADARQPWVFVALWIGAVASTGLVTLWATRARLAARAEIAILSLAALFGLAYTGAMMNARMRGSNDFAPELATFEHANGSMPLVSLRRVYHRFAYCYGREIAQVAWPEVAEDMPRDAEYFCFDKLPGYFDPPDSRESQKGTTAPLPFAWERVSEIACDPVKRKNPHATVVIGRVRRGGEQVAGREQTASRAALR
jgi:4-amino-4-deoxy-L-arabinose transferase-like glycosyltransferase